MFKLIASDMDGTLLDENGQVQPVRTSRPPISCAAPLPIACASSLRPFATRWTLSPLTVPKSTPTVRW